MKQAVPVFIGVILLMLIGLSLSTCSTFSSPTTDSILVGTFKGEVIDELGEPDEKTVIFKQSEYIWGPEEEWWHTLVMGDQVEIWIYQGKDGRLQLYFINGSEQVNFKAFVDDDIVY